MFHDINKSTIFWSSLLLIFFISACSDDDSNSDSIGSQANATLSIEQTSLNGHFFIHATESIIPDTYNLISVNYTVTDATTDEIKHQRNSESHKKHHSVLLDEGTYNVTLTMILNQVTDTTEATDGNSLLESSTLETFDDSSKIFSSGGYYYLEVEGDSSCYVICGDYTYDDDDNKTVCLAYFYISSSSYCKKQEISLEELFDTAQDHRSGIDEDDLLCMRVWGAAGEDGDDHWGDGAYGGEGGVAQTQVSYSELSDLTDSIYLLLGKDGASGVISINEPSYDEELDPTDILVLAGGGGAGGDGETIEDGGNDGGAGGNGGIVSAVTSSTCVFDKGDEGDGSDNTKFGKGGGSNDTLYDDDCIDSSILTSSAEGADNYYSSDSSLSGQDGFGGLINESTANATWYNASDAVDNHGDNGDGGNGDAYGGGGSGGGGGGYDNAGGGGGGSFAQAYYSGSNTSFCNDDGYDTNYLSESYAEFIFYDDD